MIIVDIAYGNSGHFLWTTVDNANGPVDTACGLSGHCPWSQWTLPMDSVDIAHITLKLPMDSVDLAQDVSGHYPWSQ